MRNVISLLVLFAAFNNAVPAQSPSFRTYCNPVIPGDHSDCTLTKVGDDFYTTGSSFNPTPVIYHSTDLVHWEAIAQPVSADWTEYEDVSQGGCWGGQIVLYKNKYWHFFSRANTMYFVTADKPAGPWSMPVKIKNPSQLSYGLGYDNSIFIDDDGKWYLLVKNGQPNGAIVELSDLGQPTGVVYDLKWLNPGPAYQYSWAEGPVMWKYNGYYYYSFARDVMGGQKVMRSRTITADQASWSSPVDFFNENDPDKSKAIFWGPNHSSAAILLNDSTSWVLHPVWARANNNEWFGNGRQGLLNQVRYNSNDDVVADYPVNKHFNAPKLPSSGIPWMVPHADFFSSEKLHPEWSFLGQTKSSTWSLTERSGWLRLRPKSTTKHNTVIKTEAEHNYSLITRLDFEPQTTSDEAGIRIINGKENMFVKLFCTMSSLGRKVVAFSFEDIYYEKDNTSGNIVCLKLLRENHELTAFFSQDGISWTKVGNSINVATLDKYDKDFNGWCGNRQGLYAQGRSADFDLYMYRDAYTSMLAECQANQFGTIQVNKNLDSIHNNDWALYAGVEFGNTDYPRSSDSIMIMVSSITDEAKVEIWLDSIETGKKIGTCVIGNTGSLSTFKSFYAKTSPVMGNHDVYLRFEGGNGRLMVLKSFQFISKPELSLKDASILNDSTILVDLSQNVLKPLDFSGFNIYSSNEKYIISSLHLSDNDSSLLIFVLKNKIALQDTIFLDYHNGTIKSVDSLDLQKLENVRLDNNIIGSAPIIKELQTDGNRVYIKFSKKMKDPKASLHSFFLSLNNESVNFIKNISYVPGDSFTFIIDIDTTIFYEDTVSIAYNGTSIASIDGAILKKFDYRKINNLAIGYAPEISKAIIKKTANKLNTIVLYFDRKLRSVEGQKNFFAIYVNEKKTFISSLMLEEDSILIKISPAIIEGDKLTLDYVGGTITSIYGGKLADIVKMPINSVLSDINQEEIDNNSIIYPNPAHDFISVKSEHKFERITIYSMDKKLLFSQQLQEATNYSSLHVKLACGVYFISLEIRQKRHLKKVVIN